MNEGVRVDSVDLERVESQLGERAVPALEIPERIAIKVIEQNILTEFGEELIRFKP
jgi:hypothetical protein